MATTNAERLTKALDLLRDGLKPFVERELRSVNGVQPLDKRTPPFSRMWDAAGLLKIVIDEWTPVFSRTLSQSHRSYAHELMVVRNRHAHQEAFSYSDTHRALDTAARLLTAISAKEAEQLDNLAAEIQRTLLQEQARSKTRTQAPLDVSMVTASGLKPWREVVSPHRDVASGQFAQAQFAADFSQILAGTAAAEYGDPKEFFARTHITRGLKDLMANALRRLNSTGGDPIAELQTNFGGGKTHTMIALYHLFGGRKPIELPQVEEFLKEIGATSLPKASRAVLVGTQLNAGEPWRKDDGTAVRTLWGEMAWQLGGKTAYQMVKANDENGTSPGSNLLSQLMSKFSPALVLIDEWVTFARQTYGKSDLPGGSFEANTSFAQALCEAAAKTPKSMVVVSVPSSDIEMGGEGGRAALAVLQNIVQRQAVQWSPASVEESFEIVRRRLFEPITAKAKFIDRDAAVRAFVGMYTQNSADFPLNAQQAAVLKRFEIAYPVHPALFSVLYESWGSLERFQRTRGVLRLMAAVIHELWEREDRGLLILPASVPMESEAIIAELTRYLADNWRPVISRDVDGRESLPRQLDAENNNFGKVSAARRVARVVYLGSAPLKGAQHRGIEDREVKLGCAQPGESPAVFGDALRRLADRATHLYSDGSRYWYDTTPSISRDAQDRAKLLETEPHKAHEEIKRRLRAEQRLKGEFVRLYPSPPGSADVDDVGESGIVILGPESPHTARTADSPARKAVEELLANRGNGPRHNKNSIVFLVADRARLTELEAAVRLFLAWDQIRGEFAAKRLNLDNFQAQQAQKHLESTEQTVSMRMSETYTLLLVPAQGKPDSPVEPAAPIEWIEYRLSGQGGLADRASKKLVAEGRLMTQFAGTLLRSELDRVLWKNGPDRISVRQLWDYFGQHPYLPRLRDSSVLCRAVEEGMGLMLWHQDGFAYADTWDEGRKRYIGLIAGPGQRVLVSIERPGLVVRPEMATSQLESDRVAIGAAGPGAGGPGSVTGTGSMVKDGGGVAAPVPPVKKYTRFYGSKKISPDRLGMDAATIGKEVVAHLQGLVGAKVELSIDITVEVPDGVPEGVVRTVTENFQTLKFEPASGFEEA